MHMYMLKKQIVLQLLKKSNFLPTPLPPKFTLILTFCSISLYISKKSPSANFELKN